MTPLEPFPPTRAAAMARIAAVRPAVYARSRNAVEGAVTRLSPHIKHGFVSLPEVLAGRTPRRLALDSARSVQTLADPHVGSLLPRQVVQRAPLRLFAEVDRPRASFSTWWKHSTRGVQWLADLPGLARLSTLGAAEPLFEHTVDLSIDHS